MEDIPYDVGSPEAVQIVDDELKNDVTELKNELEENDILHTTIRSTRWQANFHFKTAFFILL